MGSARYNEWVKIQIITFNKRERGRGEGRVRRQVQIDNIQLHRKQNVDVSCVRGRAQSLSSDCELFSFSLCDIVCSFIWISIGANTFFSSSRNAYSMSMVYVN